MKTKKSKRGSSPGAYSSNVTCSPPPPVMLNLFQHPDKQILKQVQNDIKTEDPETGRFRNKFGMTLKKP